GGSVNKTRLEAFSDGVIAIIITIMVLELRPPEGIDLAALEEMGPDLCAYVLSFVLLGIYWNNHHLLVGAMQRVTGGVLWANLHLLFWLSLIPFATAWMGRNPDASFPIATYGAIAFLAAVAYTILQTTIITADGRGSHLAQAVGRDVKGRMSLASYALATGLAFLYHPLSYALFVFVALLWLVPDQRIAPHHAADSNSFARRGTLISKPSAGGSANERASEPTRAEWGSRVPASERLGESEGRSPSEMISGV